MSDIIAAIATGRAPCAIGILRLSGPGCAALTGRVFTPKQPFADAPDRRLVLGLLHDRQGRVIDECLGVVCRAPHSYTGEETVELQCHGSPAMLAAGLEARSEHPLARAILKKADEDGVKYRPAGDFQAVPGKGLLGKVAGKVMAGGNEDFIRTQCALPDDLAEAGRRLSASGVTPLYFSLDRHAAGVIGVADVVKKTSKSAIDQMIANVNTRRRYSALCWRLQQVMNL